MAIVDGPGGTPADTFATVWDLAEGFAILAATADLPKPEAQQLRVIASRMRRRAAAIGKEALSKHLDTACQRLAIQAGQ